MKQLIEELARFVSPSGSERDLQRALLDRVHDVADETRVDALANGIAIKRGEGPHVMLVAHADEIGVMVIDIQDTGFLRIVAVGRVEPKSLIGRHIAFANGVIGVCGHQSSIKDADIAFEHLYVDIGCSSFAEARQRVRIGQAGVVMEPVVELGEHHLAGRALDNRVGCAIALTAFRSLASEGRNVSVVFTAQHEPGARGAPAAAFQLMPELAIVIDATPAGDTPDGMRSSVKLGEGPAIKIMDGTAIVPYAVKAHMERAAERENIKIQYEIWPASLAETGAVQQTQRGVLVGGISYPARYVGGPSNVVHLRDVEEAVRLTVEVARTYTESSL